ncbi:MAG: J domain-containing protein [Alphaproteobacteria bacterium]|nr:J domain-containing protein [Alphaproteobacteria bacterium]
MRTGSRKLDAPSADTPRSERTCEHPQCSRPGDYRAPRSRNLDNYYWFCLDHVRDYNKAWDYYFGMSQAEIENHIRHDTVWRRPTWPLGKGREQFDPRTVGDRFGLFEEDGIDVSCRKPATTPEYDAMRIMELLPPLTKESLKKRYKELVKCLHPDTHNGDKVAEEQLKVIIDAYKTLMRSLNV